jgi:ABC-type bacteriocin/lantibiotic exporter with double-glycine peptidase domain
LHIKKQQYNINFTKGLDRVKKIFYLRRLLYFAYKNNPILALFPIISIISILAELLSMLSLLPLSLISTGQDINPRDPVIRIFALIHLTPTPKILIILFSSLFIFRIITNIVSQSISLKYGKKILAQLASRSFSNIVKHCPLSEIEEKSIGHFISLAGDESFRASTIVIEIHQLVNILVLGFLYFALIFWQSPMIAICVFVFLSISFTLMGTTLKMTRLLGVTQIQQSKLASTIFLDALNGLRTVRSYLAENFVVNAYRNNMHNYTSTLYRIDLINILIKFVPIIFLFTALITFMTTGLFDKYAGQTLNFVFIITILLFLMRFFPIVGQALNLLMRLISDAKAAHDVIESIDFQIIETLGDIVIENNIKFLTIEQLSFSYKTGFPIFKDLNFTFESGNSYALVGPSGVGKSTLFNLLSFLTEVQNGDILINNQSHAKLNIHSLRKKIILVEQQSIIFSDTVFNNINFGENYTLDEVKLACKVACIDEFITFLDEGYHFKLNYQGQNLSGGQRQRIGLARAILRQPDVLLLDEITSALDEATKVRVIESVLSHFKDKIIIFITHDQVVTEYVDIKLNFENHEVIHCPKNNALLQTGDASLLESS